MGAQPAVQHRRFGEEHYAKREAYSPKETNRAPIQPVASSSRHEHKAQTQIDNCHECRVVESGDRSLGRFSAELEAGLGES